MLGIQSLWRMEVVVIGTIIGDIVGSRFEHHNYRDKDFILFHKACRYTDDSVLAIATMQTLLTDMDFTSGYKSFASKYPNRGYGGNFFRWVHSNRVGGYGSYGNGSAMRVSPIGLLYQDLSEVLETATMSAKVTHDHLEGLKGAQAVAHMIYLAINNYNKEDMKAIISETYGYNLNSSLASIRAIEGFDASCQVTVPQAMIAFLASHDFEDAIRTAVSLGGDSDTIAAICGGIAEAYYKDIDHHLMYEAVHKLDPELRVIIYKFYSKVRQTYHRNYMTELLEILEPFIS